MHCCFSNTRLVCHFLIKDAKHFLDQAYDSEDLLLFFPLWDLQNCWLYKLSNGRISPLALGIFILHCCLTVASRQLKHFYHPSYDAILLKKRQSSKEPVEVVYFVKWLSGSNAESLYCRLSRTDQLSHFSQQKWSENVFSWSFSVWKKICFTITDE